jgi:hypothetical protein
MIPTIGLIVAMYVVLRCLDMLCASESRYASKRAHTVVVVACALTIAFTGLMMTELLSSGTAGSNVLSDLSSMSGMLSDTSLRSSPPPKRTPAEQEKYNLEMRELIRKTRAAESQSPN